MPPAIASLRNLLAEFRPAKGSFRGEVLQSFLTNVAMTGLTVISGVLLALGFTGPEPSPIIALVQKRRQGRD